MVTPEILFLDVEINGYVAVSILAIVGRSSMLYIGSLVLLTYKVTVVVCTYIRNSALSTHRKRHGFFVGLGKFEYNILMTAYRTNRQIVENSDVV